MLCFLCGKEIGWLRSMADRQYCCAEHRAEARMASAHVLREEEDEAELWSVSRNRQKKAARQNQSNQTASIFAFVALAALLLAMILLPGGKSESSGGVFPTVAEQPGAEHSLFGKVVDNLGAMVRDSAPVTLHHDFRNGLSDWTMAALESGTHVDDPHDWRIPGAPAVVPAGSLRLWTQSISLHNYQMEFQGELERRSLSWAFRATNSANYYASKLIITRPGPLPNAGLVHYVMLNGRELDRVQLPLPLTIEQGQSYRVRVSVQDDRFVTYLNGQAISSWTDARLTHGGVGFFAGDDDQQRIAWVNLSERDSFMGRMLAHFSLFVMPGATAPR